MESRDAGTRSRQSALGACRTGNDSHTFESVRVGGGCRAGRWRRNADEVARCGEALASRQGTRSESALGACRAGIDSHTFESVRVGGWCRAGRWRRNVDGVARCGEALPSRHRVHAARGLTLTLSKV